MPAGAVEWRRQRPGSACKGWAAGIARTPSAIETLPLLRRAAQPSPVHRASVRRLSGDCGAALTPERCSKGCANPQSLDAPASGALRDSSLGWPPQRARNGGSIARALPPRPAHWHLQFQQTRRQPGAGELLHMRLWHCHRVVRGPWRRKLAGMDCGLCLSCKRQLGGKVRTAKSKRSELEGSANIGASMKWGATTAKRKYRILPRATKRLLLLLNGRWRCEPQVHACDRSFTMADVATPLAMAIVPTPIAPFVASRACRQGAGRGAGVES